MNTFTKYARILAIGSSLTSAVLIAQTSPTGADQELGAGSSSASQSSNNASERGQERRATAPGQTRSDDVRSSQRSNNASERGQEMRSSAPGQSRATDNFSRRSSSSSSSGSSSSSSGGAGIRQRNQARSPDSTTGSSYGSGQ